MFRLEINKKYLDQYRKTYLGSLNQKLELNREVKECLKQIQNIY